MILARALIKRRPLNSRLYNTSYSLRADAGKHTLFASILLIYLLVIGMLAAHTETLKNTCYSGDKPMRLMACTAEIEDASKSDFVRGTALYSRGNIFMELGQLEEARSDFEKAIVLRPGFVLARLNNGIVCARLGVYDRSFFEFAEALKLDPLNPDIFYNRGIAFAVAGRPSEAVSDFSESLRLRPEQGGAHSYRGEAFRKLGQNDLAIADFKVAVRINPQDQQSRQRLESLISSDK